MSLLSTWNPSPDESAIYANLWAIATKGQGYLTTGDGAEFFSSSGLDRNTLHTIWNLANPHDAPTLDFKGFCIGCRSVAMAQMNAEVSEIAFKTMVRMPLPVPQFHIQHRSHNSTSSGANVSHTTSVVVPPSLPMHNSLYPSSMSTGGMMHHPMSPSSHAHYPIQQHPSVVNMQQPQQQQPYGGGGGGGYVYGVSPSPVYMPGGIVTSNMMMHPNQPLYSTHQPSTTLTYPYPYQPTTVYPPNTVPTGYPPSSLLPSNGMNNMNANNNNNLTSPGNIPGYVLPSATGTNSFLSSVPSSSNTSTTPVLSSSFPSSTVPVSHPPSVPVSTLLSTSSSIPPNNRTLTVGGNSQSFNDDDFGDFDTATVPRPTTMTVTNPNRNILPPPSTVPLAPIAAPSAKMMNSSISPSVSNVNTSILINDDDEFDEFDSVPAVVTNNLTMNAKNVINHPPVQQSISVRTEISDSISELASLDAFTIEAEKQKKLQEKACKPLGILMKETNGATQQPPPEKIPHNINDPISHTQSNTNDPFLTLVEPTVTQNVNNNKAVSDSKDADDLDFGEVTSAPPITINVISGETKPVLPVQLSVPQLTTNVTNSTDLFSAAPSTSTSSAVHMGTPNAKPSPATVSSTGTIALKRSGFAAAFAKPNNGDSSSGLHKSSALAGLTLSSTANTNDTDLFGNNLTHSAENVEKSLDKPPSSTITLRSSNNNNISPATIKIDRNHHKDVPNTDLPTVSLSDFLAASPKTTNNGTEPIENTNEDEEEVLVDIKFPTLPIKTDPFKDVPNVHPQDGDEGIIMALSFITEKVDRIVHVIKAVQEPLGLVPQEASLSSPRTPRLSLATLDAGAQQLKLAHELLTRALIRIDNLPRSPSTSMLRKEEIRCIHTVTEDIETAQAVIDSAKEETQRYIHQQKLAKERKDKQEKAAIKAKSIAPSAVPETIVPLQTKSQTTATPSDSSLKLSFNTDRYKVSPGGNNALPTVAQRQVQSSSNTALSDDIFSTVPKPIVPFVSSNDEDDFGDFDSVSTSGQNISTKISASTPATILPITGSNTASIVPINTNNGPSKITTEDDWGDFNSTNNASTTVSQPIATSSMISGLFAMPVEDEPLPILAPVAAVALSNSVNQRIEKPSTVSIPADEDDDFGDFDAAETKPTIVSLTVLTPPMLPPPVSGHLLSSPLETKAYITGSNTVRLLSPPPSSVANTLLFPSLSPSISAVPSSNPAVNKTEEVNEDWGSFDSAKGADLVPSIVPKVEDLVHSKNGSATSTTEKRTAASRKSRRKPVTPSSTEESDTSSSEDSSDSSSSSSSTSSTSSTSSSERRRRRRRRQRERERTNNRSNSNPTAQVTKVSSDKSKESSVPQTNSVPQVSKVQISDLFDDMGIPDASLPPLPLLALSVPPQPVPTTLNTVEDDFGDFNTVSTPSDVKVSPSALIPNGNKINNNIASPVVTMNSTVPLFSPSLLTSPDSNALLQPPPIPQHLLSPTDTIVVSPVAHIAKGLLLQPPPKSSSTVLFDFSSPSSIAVPSPLPVTPLSTPLPSSWNNNTLPIMNNPNVSDNDDDWGDFDASTTMSAEIGKVISPPFVPHQDPVSINSMAISDLFSVVPLENTTVSTQVAVVTLNVTVPLLPVTNLSYGPNFLYMYRKSRYDNCAKEINRYNQEKALAIEDDRLEDAVKFKTLAKDGLQRANLSWGKIIGSNSKPDTHADIVNKGIAEISLRNVLGNHTIDQSLHLATEIYHSEHSSVSLPIVQNIQQLYGLDNSLGVIVYSYQLQRLLQYDTLVTNETSLRSILARTEQEFSGTFRTFDQLVKEAVLLGSSPLSSIGSVVLEKVWHSPRFSETLTGLSKKIDYCTLLHRTLLYDVALPETSSLMQSLRTTEKSMKELYDLLFNVYTVSRSVPSVLNTLDQSPVGLAWNMYQSAYHKYISKATYENNTQKLQYLTLYHALQNWMQTTVASSLSSINDNSGTVLLDQSDSVLYTYLRKYGKDSVSGIDYGNVVSIKDMVCSWCFSFHNGNYNDEEGNEHQVCKRNGQSS